MTQRDAVARAGATSSPSLEAPPQARLVVALIVVAAGAARIGVHDLLRGYYTTHGATVVRFTVSSRFARRDLHEILVVPAGGGKGRELLVLLHGRGSGAKSKLRQHLFDALHDLGSRPRCSVLSARTRLRSGSAAATRPLARTTMPRTSRVTT